MDGEAIKNSNSIKKEIVDFYQKLYSENESWRPSGGCWEGHKISEEDNRMLQGNFKRYGSV